MTIEQIQSHIDEMERMLFINSLQQLEIEELEQMQGKAKELKEAFLETSFVDYKVGELEEIRFKLAEITFGIEISIKEKLHEDVTSSIRKLQILYRTA